MPSEQTDGGPAFEPGKWQDIISDFLLENSFYIEGKSANDIAGELVGLLLEAGLLSEDKGHTAARSHMITAAPDMLATLKAVDAVGMINPTGSSAVEHARQLVRTTISKAEGRS